MLTPPLTRSPGAEVASDRAAGPDLIPLERLEERICSGAGHLAAATAAWLGLVAEYDRRRGWASWEARSCAHWLSWRAGIGLVAAREHVRVARALENLPELAAEFTAGRFSYSKVRALTRIANEHNESDLATIARHATGAHTEAIVRTHRRVQSLQDVNARHEARSASWAWSPDGQFLLRARLSPEDGALIIAALEAATQALAGEDEANGASARAPAEASGTTADDSAVSPPGRGDPSPNGEPGTAGEPDGTGGSGTASVAAGGRAARRARAQLNADALLVLAQTLLASGPKPLPGGERHHVNLHTDLATLLAAEPDTDTDTDTDADADTGTGTGTTSAGQNTDAPVHDQPGDPPQPGQATTPAPPTGPAPGAEHRSGRSSLGLAPLVGSGIEAGPRLHPETLRRLSCNSAATIIAHHQAGRPGTSMDVGRQTRIIPTPLRRAVVLRDRGCRFPSCTQTRFVDCHHVIHWSRGGRTDLANLILLCEKHHRAVHEGGFGLRHDGRSGFTFTRPDRHHLTPGPVPFTATPREPATLHEAPVNARTATPDWHGESLDLDLTIWALFGNEKLSRTRAAQAAQHAGQPTGHDSAESPVPAGPPDPRLN